MPTAGDDEAHIRAIMHQWAEAVRAKDSAGLSAHVASNVLLFDLITPLRNQGSDGLKKRAEQWLSSFDGPVEYELRDLKITAGDDVAFCTSLNRVAGTTHNGPLDMWWRATVCFQKVDGLWTVTHEHSSVPFDPATGNVAMNLQP